MAVVGLKVCRQEAVYRTVRYAHELCTIHGLGWMNALLGWVLDKEGLPTLNNMSNPSSKTKTVINKSPHTSTIHHNHVSRQIQNRKDGSQVEKAVRLSSLVIFCD